MNPELLSALADLQEETVRLCRRIWQSHPPVPLTTEFGTGSPSDPVVIAGVGELRIPHTGSIPEKPYVVREAAPGTVRQPHQQFTNVRQVRNDAVIPDPKPAGAHHILLLVLLPAFVIVLAVGIQTQTEIKQLVSQWIPILNDVAILFEKLIREFWPNS
jgi:hypothetical protein